MSTRKTSSTAYTSSTLKRNRRYLDIEKLNHEESHQNIKRRKPRNVSSSVKARINRSFSNSTAALTERLGRDISKYKQRVSSAERPQTAQSFYTARESTTPSQKGIRGVGIGQHLSREQYYKVRSKPVLDERLFCNYKQEKPDQAHTVNLARGPERDFDNSLKHINDIEYNTQKLYQDYYYKRTTMDCRLHYKKQKQEQRYFFIPKREENKPATDLSPKAVKKAQEAVQIKRPVDSFYMNSGRQLPCQFDQRVGTNLTSHWRNSSDVIERPHPEYSVREMKEKLFEERKEKIENSKKAHFDRGEVCDRKYFVITGQC